MVTDDLRKRLDRLEALRADKADAERERCYDPDAPYLAIWKADVEVVNTFPALAAELRRLWVIEDGMASLRAEAAALHAQLQAQAYVVPEGAQLVVPPYVGRVGYVLVRGGHVAVQEVTP